MSPLSKKIMPVATENDDFGYGISEFFGLFRLADSQASYQSGDFSTTWFVTSWMFSVETLIEEVKPVITDKIELKNWKKLKFRALFLGFSLTGFWYKNQSEENANKGSSICKNIFMDTSTKEVKLLVTDKYEFENKYSTNVRAAFSDYQTVRFWFGKQC